jgi:hypothetical protein
MEHVLTDHLDKSISSVRSMTIHTSRVQQTSTGKYLCVSHVEYLETVYKLLEDKRD